MRHARLTQAEACEICSWSYPVDYSWNTVAQGSENRYYLEHEKMRHKDYYALYDEYGLAGYYAINARIRKGYAALRLTLRPDMDNEVTAIQYVIDQTRRDFPDCVYLNVSAYSDQPHAIATYQLLGFENKGPVVASAHDMSSYEQEGFDVDDSGKPIKPVELIVLSLKL